jgi:hypothetical protein
MRHALFGALVLSLACNQADDDDTGPQYELPQILAQDSPLCLSYEPTTLGETRSFATTLRNDGRQQLVIEDGEIIEDERGYFSLFGIDPKTVNTFEHAAVQIRYEPVEEGWDTALLEIRSNAQNYPTYRIFILALGRPEGAPDTWDPGPKPEEAFASSGEEACKNDYKPRQ